MNDFESLFDQLPPDVQSYYVEVMKRFIAIDRKYKELIQCNK